VALEIKQKALEYCLEFWAHGQQRVANELRKKGLMVSARGIRSIWLRHHLQVKSLRLKKLEQWEAEEANVLTESQIQALGEAK
jgi:hypothetical protein